ncbi:MAG: hypothetical protein QOG15_2715 [Solirubrobacteraceae bacterium]|jgi:hypothetical protein|nr:hypothetical protein [Solirubrobacteraceae bacterium]
MRRHLLLLSVTAIGFTGVGAAVASADSLVTTGSPPAPFSQNKQNEPGLAINPLAPNVVVSGANDEIDLEACNAGEPDTCPFTEGVGVSGVTFSFNGGSSWIQPTYQGLTARDCLGPEECVPHPGPIGTLPGYYERGLSSGGDPALAFGPRRGADGRFAWSNGARLYYVNLAANLPGSGAFNGVEAIAISRTDDVNAAAAGSNAAWMAPVLLSKQSSATFSDKEEIAADDAASSPHFGNVYVCNVAFRGNGTGGGGEPLMFARSTDGGTTWSQRQITAATNNTQTGGRQGCMVRTDSRGGVFVFWVGTDTKTGATVFFEARSFDGGISFDKPRIVASVVDVGLPDPATGRLSFDGVAGARSSTFPSVDIANGAPTGAGATDEIVLTGPDGPTPDTSGTPNERAIIRYSTDRGATFLSAPSASPPSDRPMFPAIAISPDGDDVYVTYNAFHAPWQHDTSAPRLMEDVVRHATLDAGGAPDGFADISRTSGGDARGSSQNNLVAEFLGDYNTIGATNDGAVAVYNDTRRAADCPAIDAYRDDFVAAVLAGTAQPADEDAGEGGGEESDAPAGGTAAPAAPEPQQDCPAAFGNSDIFGGPFG